MKLVLALTLVLALARPGFAAAPSWKAGVATTVITPTKSLWMTGFGARTYASAGTLLELRAKALLPVHWIGLPCEMDHICAFAKEKGLIVLEDACHAHGASMQGKFMGSWGRMAAFSFQATKPLPAIEGGLALYQERADYERGSTLGHYDKPHDRT